MNYDHSDIQIYHYKGLMQRLNMGQHVTLHFFVMFSCDLFKCETIYVGKVVYGIFLYNLLFEA